MAKPPKKKKGARGANGSSKPPQAAGPLEMDDLFVRRTSEGALVPLTVPVFALGGKTIDVLPTTIGSVKGLTALDQNCIEWKLEEKIQYVRDHVVRPPLGEATPEEIIENMTLWDLDMVLVAAVQGGGAQRSKSQGKE